MPGMQNAAEKFVKAMDGSASSSSPSRSSNSRFKTLPILHPHEVELRVNVKELSRPIAPEKFRSKTKSVGGFVFGLLVFPQGTKSAPEHARKNRGDDDDKNPKKGPEETVKKQRWISAFVEARPSEDYPANWYYQDVQFLVSLINHEEVARSIVKHDKHTFSPTESSDGKAIDRGWHDFVSCDEQTLRESGFVDADDHVCFRASVYLAGGPMKVTISKTKRYLELQKMDGPLYCNSLVQTLFHLGLFRNLIYGETNSYTGGLSYGSAKSRVDNSVVNQPVGWKGGKGELLRAFRDTCYKLQLRTSQVVSCKDFPHIEGNSLETWFTNFYNHLLSAMMPESEGSNEKTKRKSKKEHTQSSLNRAEQFRDLLEFDIQWTGQDEKKGKKMDLPFRGPVFSFLIRGFSDLETCLCHYFAKKRTLNSGDGVCTARRVIRSLPPITMWHLKRGEYDPEGIPDTYFEFPRRVDMGRYVEARDDADLHYVLYAVIVEVEPSVGHDRRYYSFLRPEMEGDKGQWYRFDDGPVNSVHAVSNATAMDASLGGEEWLCVNYLYGPGSVLTRPKSSRACMLCYIRETDAALLLKEPRLPKNVNKGKNEGMTEKRARSPVSAADEIANLRAESLIEELEQQEMREIKKKAQKQKKKQKEKEKRKTVDKDSLGSPLGQKTAESLSVPESESEAEISETTTKGKKDENEKNNVNEKMNKNEKKKESNNNNNSNNNDMPDAPGGGATTSSTLPDGKKKVKEQPATPSTGSATDARDANNNNTNANAKDNNAGTGKENGFSNKRKQHPATPSTGSTPPETKGGGGGKSSDASGMSSSGTPASGKKDTDKGANVGSEGAANTTSSNKKNAKAQEEKTQDTQPTPPNAKQQQAKGVVLLPPPLNASASASSKKERKKKGAASQGQAPAVDLGMTPSVGSHSSLQNNAKSSMESNGKVSPPAWTTPSLGSTAEADKGDKNPDDVWVPLGGKRGDKGGDKTRANNTTSSTSTTTSPLTRGLPGAPGADGKKNEENFGKPPQQQAPFGQAKSAGSGPVLPKSKPPASQGGDAQQRGSGGSYLGKPMTPSGGQRGGAGAGGSSSAGTTSAKSSQGTPQQFPKSAPVNASAKSSHANAGGSNMAGYNNITSYAASATKNATPPLQGLPPRAGAKQRAGKGGSTPTSATNVPNAHFPVAEGSATTGPHLGGGPKNDGRGDKNAKGAGGDMNARNNNANASNVSNNANTPKAGKGVFTSSSSSSNIKNTPVGAAIPTGPKAGVGIPPQAKSGRTAGAESMGGITATTTALKPEGALKDSAGNSSKTQGADTQPSHPSCSSSAGPGGWYSQQLIVDDDESRIQFECALCQRIVRRPVVLPCAHLFCHKCVLSPGWAKTHCPNPTCGMKVENLNSDNYVCLEQTKGGALALLHRVYSGLKLRCLYSEELRDQPWEELQKTSMTCTWRGFLQDYARHLEQCPAHQNAMKAPMSELGEMETIVAWKSDNLTPAIELECGDILHISNLDESKQWVYAYAGSASGQLVGWVPRNILQHKVYGVTYPFSCADDGFISLELDMKVVVYHREGNGWTYGALVDNNSTGWFPDRCIG